MISVEPGVRVVFRVNCGTVEQDHGEHITVQMDGHDNPITVHRDHLTVIPGDA